MKNENDRGEKEMLDRKSVETPGPRKEGGGDRGMFL
jgi:hypothetical protein